MGVGEGGEWHIYNPSTLQEAEGGGSQVGDRPGLYLETVSKTKTKEKQLKGS
jgi:hypothetical protein